MVVHASLLCEVHQQVTEPLIQQLLVGVDRAIARNVRKDSVGWLELPAKLFLEVLKPAGEVGVHVHLGHILLIYLVGVACGGETFV